MTCTCPSDGQKIPSTRRVLVIEPGAVVRTGQRDASKVHIFDKDCPVHGYRVLEEEGE